MPEALVEHLVKYATTRLNMHTGCSKTVPSRVTFSGFKPRANKEYALAFGDLAEVLDPKVISNTMQPRSQTCIALYPVCNSQGSWCFYNLVTGKTVRRSVWKEMVTSDLVVAHMNTLKAAVVLDEDDISNLEELTEEERIRRNRVDGVPILDRRINATVTPIEENQTITRVDDAPVMPRSHVQSADPIIAGPVNAPDVIVETIQFPRIPSIQKSRLVIRL